MVSFFADNKTVVAIANFGGATAILYLIISQVWRVTRFAIASRRVSWRDAQRKRDFRLASLGYRCADNTSTFIAVIIRQVLAFLLFMFLNLSFAVSSITSNMTRIDQASRAISSQTRLEIIISSIMAAILVAHFFTFFARLSSTVLAANERKRLAKLRVPANRRRVRTFFLF